MIKFKNVYKKNNNQVTLDNVTFTVDTGEFVFLVGPSGCGKTTIFKLLSAQDTVDSGSIMIDDYDIANIKKSQIPSLRKQIGVIFQDYKLIPNQTVAENINFVLDIYGFSGKDKKSRIMQLLDLVDMVENANKFPHQLSGGQKQKIAIARAMASSPTILLADEPTGNLDPVSTYEVMQILQKINQIGTTIIMATHEVDVVRSLDIRIIEMGKGTIISESLSNLEYLEKMAIYTGNMYNFSKTEKSPEVANKNNIAEETSKYIYNNYQPDNVEYQNQNIPVSDNRVSNVPNLNTINNTYITENNQEPSIEQSRKVIKKNVNVITSTGVRTYEVDEEVINNANRNISSHDQRKENYTTPYSHSVNQSNFEPNIDITNDEVYKSSDDEYVVTQPYSRSRYRYNYDLMQGRSIDNLGLPLELEIIIKSKDFETLYDIANLSDLEMGRNFGALNVHKIRRSLRIFEINN